MKSPVHFYDRLFLFKVLLVLIIAIGFTDVRATHEKNEPSDGTVRSFRAVTKKIEVPAVTFFDHAVQPANIKNFRGKIVLLNIWATWCGPCLRELPALDRLQAKFSKSDFVILPISIDKQNIDVTRSYHQKLGLKDLDFYYDASQQLGRFFPLDVVPANFIIGRDGKPISFLRSFVDWDDELAVEMIQYYIKQKDVSQGIWIPPHLVKKITKGYPDGQL